MYSLIIRQIQKYYYNRYSKYEYLLENHKTLQVYKSILEEDDTLKKYDSAQEITFHKSLQFKDTKNKVKKILGTPNYQVTNSENEHVDIFFYKIKIGKQRIQCEAHFYKNGLFLCSYSFSYKKKQDRALIFSFLNEKYGIHEHARFPVKVNDINYRSLIVSKHIGVTLNYFDRSHVFFDQLTKYFKRKSIHEERYHLKLQQFYSSL